MDLDGFSPGLIAQLHQFLTPYQGHYQFAESLMERARHQFITAHQPFGGMQAHPDDIDACFIEYLVYSSCPRYCLVELKHPEFALIV